MRRLRRRLTISSMQAVIALALLGCFSIAAAQSVQHFTQAKKKPKARPYAITSSFAKTKTAFNIKLAAPGDSGVANVTLQNVGTKPARIRAAKQKQIRSSLDPYLSVSVYDATTKQCYYPKPKPAKVKKPKPKKGKKPSRPLRAKPSGPCTTTAAWTSLPGSLALTPIIKGKYVVKGAAAVQWKRKERHKLTIAWRIDPAAPASVQNLTSSFDLRWRATK